jgi:hypothetical protein
MKPAVETFTIPMLTGVPAPVCGPDDDTVRIHVTPSPSKRRNAKLGQDDLLSEIVKTARALPRSERTAFFRKISAVIFTYA